MLYEEITPYLNKIVRLNLRNKKRKLGWLVVDHYHEISENPLKEVHCVNVRFGKKHIEVNRKFDMKVLDREAEIFQIKDILSIRACL
jgi:hypothetical protein